ncbi:MAG: bifunctional UDP-N-acetylglucosamine diphosphorylase/glucosamine-1-phosphate N-acetyltransferase GlmU [Burkholderiales bacterium]|nr:bifunctional UDP-N-acetylglucosamine diphosphorylase/glucosamine-1-phosphate N-acetyltransferase GlmU [Burkholderiales bacterium]
MNVIILAAGKGTRMHSNLPKVLHPIAGVSMLAHVLNTARQTQLRRAIVVYGHGADQVQAAFAGQDIHWALQAPQLGTGHAVQMALPFLSDEFPTLILYGDVPLTSAVSLQKLIDVAGDHHVGLMTLLLEEPKGYGRIVRNQSDEVTRIVEEKDADESEKQIREVNTGLMLVPTAMLRRWVSSLENNNAQKEYYLTDIIASAHRDGVLVNTCQPEFEWEVLGVNSREQQAQLERIYQEQFARKLMTQGVTLSDPQRIDVRGSLVCGRDVFIDVGCIFEGDVVLEDNVSIGPYCVVKNATLSAGTRLEAYCHLEKAQVGAQSHIGPYARLRPGTQLAESVHVGNFVEIKNSNIGKQSKANHLAYVGDADVGARVNIGAGSITCNYDGANKHRTTIEDDVFIGSDTQLVAPVRVGAGATLGAGTTLVKDAPAGQLTVSRPKQLTVTGWKRPLKKDVVPEKKD